MRYCDYDKTNIRLCDGAGKVWWFETNGKSPDLIGHKYIIKGVKGVLLNTGFCQEDFHYAGNPNFKRKEPIPKGTEVEVICYWFNFYGVYFRVEYNNRYYDIDTSDIKLVRKEE